MNQFALLPSADRALVFEQAAARRGLGSALVFEKDFWVCWTLQQIFATLTPPPLFKGGTSLSKAYGLIQRFSEDVDLVIDRHTLGFTGENDPTAQTGSNQRKRTLESLKANCSHTVQHRVQPALENRFRQVLGDANWTLHVDARDPQCLLLQYPNGLNAAKKIAAPPYLQPVVRLEFGCRGDVWPNEQREVVPYVAEVFPQLFTAPRCDVVVLKPARTFWEKATLLHAVNHSGKTPDRLSRHYYDVSRMYRHEIGKAALQNTDLLATVAHHKAVFFREPAAHYETACPGTLKLTPERALEAALRRDWRDMSEMIFGDVPSFDEILGDIREIEEHINGIG